MKKFISFILIILILCANSAYAAEKVKFYAGMQTEFKTNEVTPDVVEFITTEDVSINDIVIPSGALINAKICQFQKERRWHKSGYFLCNIVSYMPLGASEIIDVSEKEIYFIVRKYEALSKKDASILTTEIILTQAASIVGSCFIFFAPVDIAYFFTKGAIKKEKHPNWFKSGVMEAYDNSIFWFQLKGKPIELAEGDDIKLQSISKKKAEKLKAKISKRKARIERRNEKKAAKAERKNRKKSSDAVLDAS